MMNIDEARKLYNELHSPEKDEVGYYLNIIKDGILQAIIAKKSSLYFMFDHESTNETIIRVCSALSNLGFRVEDRLTGTDNWGSTVIKRSYPIRITIYGWV